MVAGEIQDRDERARRTSFPGWSSRYRGVRHGWLGSVPTALRVGVAFVVAWICLSALPGRAVAQNAATIQAVAVVVEAPAPSRLLKDLLLRPPIEGKEGRRDYQVGGRVYAVVSRLRGHELEVRLEYVGN